MYRYMSMLVNANSCEWIVLDGRLDLERLRRAARSVARRHAVLNSVQRRRGVAFYWQPWPDEKDVELRFERLPAMSDTERHRHLVNNIWREQLPLTDGRPWRLHVSEELAGRTWLQIITTHVFTDGRSANVVARDLAHAYTAAADAARDPVLSPGAGPDPQRDPFKLFTADLPAAERCRLTLGALAAIGRDAVAPCGKLVLPSGPVGETGVLFFDFGEATWQRVRRAGRAAGLSAHPFLLGAVLRSIESWNASRGRKTRTLRVIDNFSLRRFSHQPDIQEIYDVFAIPYSLDFQLDADDGVLLQQIRRKLDRMKNGEVLRELFRQKLYMLSSALSPKRLATKLVTRFVVRSNVICTNIGPVPEDFDRFGSARVQEYFSFSQMFPPGELMFLFSTCRGRLRAVLLFDRNKIAEPQARALVDEVYTGHLMRLSRAGEESVPPAGMPHDKPAPHLVPVNAI